MLRKCNSADLMVAKIISNAHILQNTRVVYITVNVKFNCSFIYLLCLRWKIKIPDMVDNTGLVTHQIDDNSIFGVSDNWLLVVVFMT